MTKLERNELIIKLVQESKSQEVIAKECDCSVRTIQRVIESQLGKTTRSKNVESDKSGHFISEEMWEELQDRIDFLFDTVEIQSATIKSLQAELITATKVNCNELISDKKYIVRKYSTGEVIGYSNGDDLGIWIKIIKNIASRTDTIDKSILEKGNWICKPDDIEILPTAEIKINSSNDMMRVLSDISSNMLEDIDNIKKNM